MKTSWLITTLLALAAIRTQGQASQSGPALVTGQGAAPLQDTSWAVNSRSASSRTWQKTSYEVTQGGQTVPRLHQVVELATGLCVLKNGQWKDSSEEIVILPDGSAGATNLQTQVYFPSDIGSGAIRLITPESAVLQNGPAVLDFDDGTNLVILGIVTNSVGQLVSSNQVLYPDIFHGSGFQGDFLCTVRKSGFECDLVFREQIPDPVSLGLGSNARLQLLTEFFNPPAPAQVAGTRDPQDGLSDTTLTFGTMRLGRGTAFSMGETSGGPIHRGGIPVYKEWVSVAGRTFLVEELPYQRIAPQLEQMPVPTATGTAVSSRGMYRLVPSANWVPPIRLAHVGSKQIQLARTDFCPTRGVVLDYVTVDSNTNDFTFQGDTTYLISGYYLFGGTCTIEGGTVIKFSTNSAAGPCLDCTGNLVFTTGSYRPAILTSMNDNTVGETISGSTGNPAPIVNAYYIVLDSASCTNVSNLRFSYAQCAVCPYITPGAVDVWNCQISHCFEAVENWWIPQVRLHNVLIDSCGAVLVNEDSSRAFSGENITVTSTNFVDPDSASATSINLTNSIVLCSPSSFWTATLQTNYTVINPSGTLFQSVGAGSYYLTNDSPYRNAGSTNISPVLLAALAQKTTYAPPIVLTNFTISSQAGACFSPQVERDWDLPDLGYHYDPLDYLCSQITVSGAALVLTDGVAVGLFGGVGFTAQGSGFISQGRPDAMNRLVWYPSVQEQPIKINGVSTAGSVLFSVVNNINVIGLHFTDIAMLGARQKFFDNCYVYNMPMVGLSDCWLRGIDLTVSGYIQNAYLGASVTLQNCLLERSTVSLFNGYTVQYGSGSPVYYQNPLSVNLFNNLFWQSALALSYYDSQATYHLGMAVKDNLFDTATFTFQGDGSYGNYVSVANDGFYSTTNALGGTNLVTVTNLTYATGPLGWRYIGAACPTIVDKGSRTADLAGLYHHTEFTNLVSSYEVPETNSVVDIGFHYVATDANGSPFDSNGDGILDYLEDINGNGLVDSGELGWNIVGDLGLNVIITRPRNGSTLP